MPDIDLHTHSTASDGTLTPRELVAEAAQAGLAALALTDHDTTAGNSEALEAGREFGIEVIPGCELGVECSSGVMHIVGLWVPEAPAALNATLEFFRNSRTRRNSKIIEKLRSMGVDITLEEVEKLAGTTVGRPHIARAMVRAGAVKSVDEAFGRYIGNKGPAHVPKDKLSPEKAIAVLKRDGATSVLAHPKLVGLTFHHLEQCLNELKGIGLDGMEVFYSDHTEQETAELGGIARRLGLAVSGGSDYHGAVKPDIALGRGFGGLHVPEFVLHDLKKLRRSQGLPA